MVLFLTQFGLTVPALAQQAKELTVTGTITDEANEPMAAVTILVVDTSVGTSTDLNGKFSLKVPEGKNALRISFIGYETATVQIPAGNVLNFQMNLYIGGLNDVWDFTSVILSKSSAGVYTGTASITAPSSWGIKIYLAKDNWDRYYGGSFSNMVYKGANITNDQSLAPGTYNVTVDFLHNTCTFTVK